MIIEEKNHIQHYGTPRHSGRYPWGSGGNSESTRNRSFLDAVDMMRRQGLSQTEIARGMGITTTQLRARTTIATTQQRQEKINQAQKLKDKGYSNSAIANNMGLNESSVRSLLQPGQKDKTNVLHQTSDMLKQQVEKKNYVDIGRGVEANIGISKDKLNAAVALLKEQGYEVHTLKIQQAGTGQQTTFKVLAKPGTTQKDVWMNRSEIQQITDFSDNGGRSYYGLQPPLSVSSKRVGINYAEDGGTKADGVIYVRPGVKDVSIGSSNYAQVRIAVDGTHYLKGMAVYKDDLPEGKDLVFNTNKTSTGSKKDALKAMETDIDGNIDSVNPFGAQIKRQIIEKDSSGKDRVTSAMNIINEEGNWDKWSKNLSSQILSKQSPALAKTQLNMTYERRLNEFDSINKLTNPAVRKKLLETFANSTDSAAVHLKAAALPSQATKVLLPVSSMKPTEIYAPTFRNGTRVALIRFPHAGTFEIPELTVNNKNAEAQKLLGRQPKDAVAIHHKVAEHLSGADFDGDHVLVIPNTNRAIKTTPALEGLKGFDPQHYKIPEDSKVPHITSARKHYEMGNVTNLIADMSIRGANPDEMSRAVRHSMVVIDSEKHGLDFRASAQDNGIAALKAKYQGGSKAGASTLITRASSKTAVPERKLRPASQGGPVDKTTGKKVYVETGRTYVNKKGETTPKVTWTKRLAETDDASTLSSGTRIEEVYVDHSNKLKSLANTARKEAASTKPTKYSPSAKAAYPNEVSSLNAKLNLALKNAPLERQAQVIANTAVSQKRQANPGMDEEDVRKIKYQALSAARVRTGSDKHKIVPTQSEWDAIQAGAISNHKLTDILKNADIEAVKKLATPKQQLLMTSTKKLRAQAMANSGYTQAEIADQLGVSLSTLKAAIE